MSTTIKREVYLDIAKGIALLSIIWHHTIRGSYLIDFFSAYDLQIFILISGLLYNGTKYTGFGQFLRSKSKSLLLPYLLFSVLSYLFWLLVERHLRPGGMEIDVFTPLMGIIYGTDYKDFMVYNGALWYLPVMFLAEIYLYWLAKYVVNRWLFLCCIFVSATIGWLMEYTAMVRLPFGFNSSFVVFAILAVGYLLKDYRFLLDKYTGYKRLLIAVAFIFLLVLFSDINGNTNLDYVKYNNVYLFVLYSTIGVVAVLLMSKSIGSNRVLNYIGVNSLPLFAFSEPVKRSVIGAVSKVSHYPIDQVRSSYLISFGCVVLTLVCLMPIVYVYNRYYNKLVTLFLKN